MTNSPWFKRIMIGVTILAMTTILLAVSLWTLGGVPSWAMQVVVNEDTELSTCTSAIWTEKASDECYATVVKSMVQRDGTSAVKQLEESANSNPEFQSVCHLIMHDVAGPYVRQQVRDGVPIKTLSDVNGDGICAAGYVHELMIVAAGGATSPAKVIEATSLCTDDFGIERYSCLHGLGHSVLAGAKRDVVKATALCASDQLSSELQQTCTQGAFHEYVIRMDIDSSFDLDGLCQSLLPSAAAWCYGRGLDVAGTAPPATSSAIRDTCNSAPDDLLQSCIAGASWSSRDKIPRKIDACLGLDEQFTASCLRGTTPSIRDATATKVGALYSRCEDAANEDIALNCVREIADAGAVLYGRPMASEACESLADDLQSACTTAVAVSQGDAMLF